VVCIISLNTSFHLHIDTPSTQLYPQHHFRATLGHSILVHSIVMANYTVIFSCSYFRSSFSCLDVRTLQEGEYLDVYRQAVPLLGSVCPACNSGA
jgi:hypothetical protein